MQVRNESQLFGGETPSTIIQFFLGAVKNETKSKEQKKPVHDENEFIRIMFAGDNSKVIERIVSETDQERYSIQYNKWKESADELFSGTPLTELKFMNTAMISDLHHHRVMTVEALADLSDTALQQIGMGARDWKNKAEEYLKKCAADQSVTIKMLQDQLAAAQIDRDAFKQQIKDLSDRFEEERKAKK